jgi:tRNA dimethylallyltransferase
MTGEATSPKYPLLIVLGPTASGKTKLSVSLAKELGGEIISADSRQIFRGMNIGTGKDLNEYYVEGLQVPYHLIDIKKAGTNYSVNEFKEDFYKAFLGITKRPALPILCGGTGMYINSILQNYLYTDVPVKEALRLSLSGKNLAELSAILKTYPPEFTDHADQSTVKRMIRAIEVADYLSNNELQTIKRPEIKPFVVGLEDNLLNRRGKIAIRLEKRFEEGMIDEVVNLLREGVSAEMLTFYGLEYKLIVSYLEHKLTLRDLKEQLYNGICQYAKRQMTYFRKMEKDGVNIHWYQADMDPEIRKESILKDFKAETSRQD